PASKCETVPLVTTTPLRPITLMPTPSPMSAIPNTEWPFRSSLMPSPPTTSPPLEQGPTSPCSRVSTVITSPHLTSPAPATPANRVPVTRSPAAIAATAFTGANRLTSSKLLPSVMSAPLALPARRDLLHGPAVPVRVGEEHERAPVELLDLADLDSALDELGPGGMDVRHDELEALDRTWLHLAQPGPEGDRAAGARRRELDEAELVAYLVVVVRVEAQLLGVEG